MTIKWTNDNIRLGDLKPWERNPRYSTEEDAEAIAESHELWGQPQVIAVDAENNIVDGHQRLSAWIAKYGPDFEVAVRRADKVFEEAEKQAFTATMHAKATGRWLFTEVANWGWDADEYKSFFGEDTPRKLHDEAFAMEAAFGVENLEDIEFKEYDEDIADEVEMITCPHCGKEFPK